jgi:hypothetical protein
MGFDLCTGEKARCEIAKGHLLVSQRLNQPELSCRGLILALDFYLSSQALVGSPGGLLTPDAVDIVDRPPDIATLP